MDDYMLDEDDDPSQRSFSHQNGLDRTQTSAYTLRRPTAPSHPVPPPSFPYGQTSSSSPSDQNLTLDISACITPSRLSPLTRTDLHHLTTTTTTSNNPLQSVTTMTTSWTHEMRWEVHRMLDWLYIGPCSAVKDERLMREKGITMVVVANGMRVKGRTWPSIERAREGGGFEVEYIDASGPPGRLVSQLGRAVRVVNGHLKRKIQEAEGLGGGGEKGMEWKPPRVLIACEDGNGRSAMIAGGYIISMWEVDMVFAAQWVSTSRLSASFEDEVKGGLVQWRDIVRAMREVEQQGQADGGQGGFYGGFGSEGTEVMPTTMLSPSRERRKRGLEDDDEAGDGMEGVRPEDWERFAGREFAPFRDRSPRI